MKLTEQNKEMVEKLHEDMENSRSIQLRRKVEFEQKGKQEHSSYLFEKLRLNNAQQVLNVLPQRKNSVLKQKLQESLMTCSRDMESTKTELKQYTISLKDRHGAGIKKFNSTHTTVC